MENQFGRPKRSSKPTKFFLNLRPRENSRSVPGFKFFGLNKKKQ